MGYQVCSNCVIKEGVRINTEGNVKEFDKDIPPFFCHIVPPCVSVFEVNVGDHSFSLRAHVPEKGCSNLFAQWVRVNLMWNGGDKGVGPVTTSQVEIATIHKVQLSRRQRGIRSKPSTWSSASIQGVNLKSKVEVSA